VSYGVKGSTEGLPGERFRRHRAERDAATATADAAAAAATSAAAVATARMLAQPENYQLKVFIDRYVSDAWSRTMILWRGRNCATFSADVDMATCAVSCARSTFCRILPGR
jgi:hypothetical protein